MEIVPNGKVKKSVCYTLTLTAPINEGDKYTYRLPGDILRAHHSWSPEDTMSPGMMVWCTGMSSETSLTPIKGHILKRVTTYEAVTKWSETEVVCDIEGRYTPLPVPD